jgi:hypothetical protein
MPREISCSQCLHFWDMYGVRAVWNCDVCGRGYCELHRAIGERHRKSAHPGS